MQSFDIRFARSAGLMGLFEAPANSFRWKGGGQLTVDDQCVTVSALSRLPFLTRRLRFSSTDLRQAYREGEVVRLEFAEARGAVVLPVWAKDAQVAAEIVRALPTTRTVEFERSPDDRLPRVRYDKRLVVSACIAGALLLLGIILLRIPSNAPEQIAITPTEFIPDPAVLEASGPLVAAETAPEPIATLPAPLPERQTIPIADSALTRPASRDAPSIPAPVEADNEPAPRASASKAATEDPAPKAMEEAEAEPFVPSIPGIHIGPADLAVPIRKNTIAFDTAEHLLSWFQKIASENNEKFAVYLADMDGGRMNEREFIRKLSELEWRWRNLTSGLLATSEAKVPELTGFRGSLLAVVSYQASFFDGYASGLRTNNQDSIGKAFAERERADEALERARMYLR